MRIEPNSRIREDAAYWVYRSNLHSIQQYRMDYGLVGSKKKIDNNKDVSDGRYLFSTPIQSSYPLLTPLPNPSI
jgi:hypothetical protein